MWDSAVHCRHAAPAAFRTRGVFGTKHMPEDLLPEGVTPGTEEHRRFVTLTNRAPRVPH